MISDLTAFFKYLILFFLSRFFPYVFSLYSLVSRFCFRFILKKNRFFCGFSTYKKFRRQVAPVKLFLSLFYLFKLYESIPCFMRSRFPVPLRRYRAFWNTLPLFSPQYLRDRFRRSSPRRYRTLRL